MPNQRIKAEKARNNTIDVRSAASATEQPRWTDPRGTPSLPDKRRCRGNVAQRGRVREPNEDAQWQEIFRKGGGYELLVASASAAYCRKFFATRVRKTCIDAGLPLWRRRSCFRYLAVQTFRRQRSSQVGGRSRSGMRLTCSLSAQFAEQYTTEC
jgi:hypothetical protein